MLVVRGDLLKRYPNTIIYAQRAQWSTDPARPNELALIDETGAMTSADPAEPGHPLPALQGAGRAGHPLHRLRPDAASKCAAPTVSTRRPRPRRRFPASELGWFFVLQEVVGEPRFGLDETSAVAGPTTNKWDNLSWQNLGDVHDRRLRPAVRDGGARYRAGRRSAVGGATPPTSPSILYQKPVLVAVHGREMIKDLPPSGSPWTD